MSDASGKWQALDVISKEAHKCMNKEQLQQQPQQQQQTPQLQKTQTPPTAATNYHYANDEKIAALQSKITALETDFRKLKDGLTLAFRVIKESNIIT